MSTENVSSATSTQKRPGLIQLSEELIHLTPRQFSDEVSLAKLEVKDSAKHFLRAGIGAVIALVMLALLVIALVVAAILGLATVLPAWFAALIVAALFLVILALGALIAYLQIRRGLPAQPVQAIRGLRYDVGVLREGAQFNPASLDKVKEKKHDDEADDSAETSSKKKDQEKAPAPSYDELVERLDERRKHMLNVRDGLGEKLDVKAQAEYVKEDAQAFLGTLGKKVSRFVDTRKSESTPQSEDQSVAAQTYLQERWPYLALFGASVIAVVVGVAKLIKAK